MRTLAEIEEGAAAASSGPWEHNFEKYGSNDVYSAFATEPISSGTRPLRVLDFGCGCCQVDGPKDADLLFAANARMDVPILCKALTSLSKQVYTFCGYDTPQQMVNELLQFVAEGKGDNK